MMLQTETEPSQFSPVLRHEEVGCKKGTTSTEKCCDCVFVCSCAVFIHAFGCRMHMAHVIFMFIYNSCLYVAPCVKTRGLEI